MSASFRYPDADDSMVQDFVARDFGTDYWAGSEDRVLRRAQEALARRYGDGLSGLSLLDVGCGTGRLMPRFARLVGQVTGVEPDAGRCREARELLAREGIANATVFHGTLKELPKRQFQVVLCSHVLQHISPATAAEVLENIAGSLSPAGTLILTVTYTSGPENLYTLMTRKNGQQIDWEADAARFERALREPEVLAACRFARPRLEEALGRAGLVAEAFYPYHFGEAKDPSQDEALAASPEGLRHARDALYLCRRERL